MRASIFSTSSVVIVLALLCCCCFVVAPAAAARKYHFYSDLKITSWDGTVLLAQAAVPDRIRPGEQFATVVFPNSWTMPVIEYLLETIKLAELSVPFVAVEYETRGWWGESGGEIDVAGPKDQKDIVAVIDWVCNQSAQWGVNVSAIGMAGISYGAGLSLLGAALDPRVKVAAPMSGWGSLDKSLFPNNSPCTSTVELLVVSAQIFGKPSPELIQLEHDFLEHKNISFLLEFGRKRSAAQHMAAFKTKPVFMSNNMNDEFFPADIQLEFFNQLCALQGGPGRCPSRMLINHGGHAEAEALALIGLPSNFVWAQAIKFLQFYLQGVPTDITASPLIQAETGSAPGTIFAKTYKPFARWPDPAATFPIKFGFVERGGDHFGSLTGSWPAGASAEQQRLTSSSSSSSSKVKKPPVLHHLRRVEGGAAAVDSISFSDDDGGLYPPGLIEDYLEPLGIPLDQELALVPRDHNILYKSVTIPRDSLICGHPLINISIAPSSKEWQLYSYLYEVDGIDLGRQLTWGTVSSFNQPHATSPTSLVNLQMRFMCEKVSAGKKIALGFSLYNSLYEPATKDLTVSFDYESASISLPYSPS